MTLEEFCKRYNRGTKALRKCPLHVVWMQTIHDRRPIGVRSDQKAIFTQAVGSPVEEARFSLAEEIRQIIGVIGSDVPRSLLNGSLDLFNAHYIDGGPFNIATTDEIAKNLTFVDLAGRPTLLVLSCKGILNVFLLQRSKVLRYIS